MIQSPIFLPGFRGLLAGSAPKNSPCLNLPLSVIFRPHCFAPQRTGSALLERNLEPAMNELVDPLVFWAAAAVQVLGLASVLFARLPRSSKTHDYCRGIYVGS